MIGGRNVYEFYHYYKHRDHLDNETPIINKLSSDDTTQLNLYDNDWYNIFTKQPIIVRRMMPLYYSDEGETQVHGFIKASNKSEAIRTLHYTENFEQYIQTETPVYSGLEDWDL
jgi:galactose-1-phosphate uridylyltransferase